MSKDMDRIQDMINRLKREARAIVHNCIELSYFMRGAIQYHDMLLTTPAEREIFSDFISKRLDSQKKSMHPVY